MIEHVVSACEEPACSSAPDLPIRCPLCAGAVGSLLLWGRDMMYDHPERFAVVGCRQCGFAQSWPALSPEALARYYPASYFAPVVRASRPAFAERVLRLGRRLHDQIHRGVSTSHVACRIPPRWIDLALPHRGEPGRLLDVGSGSGRFLAGALALGWRGEAVDHSPKVHEVGKVLAVPAYEGVLEQVAGRITPGFDLISFNHVLEHVAALEETLEVARSLLAPGGIVRIQIPLWRPWWVRRFGRYWSSLDLPRHRWNFRVEDLTRLAARVELSRVLFLPETGTHIVSSSVRLWLKHHGGLHRWESWASVDNRLLRAALFPLGWAAAAAGRPFEGTFYLMAD